MKLKPDAEQVVTSEFFYDLFDGGYIDPEDLLVEKDAARVRKAMSLILEFRTFLEEKEMLEYC